MEDTEEPKNTGRFGKGNPGKPHGANNKVTTQLKEMILQALDESGGVSYLVTQAEKSPSAFLSLIAKVLPMTVVGGGEDGEFVIRTIERVIVKK